MKQFIKFLTKLKGFWKLYQNYECDGETAEFIIENYTKVLCNRTKLMSKPTYYARDVIAQIDNWFEEMGYTYIERRDKPKYNYDKFKTVLSTEELAKEIVESIRNAPYGPLKQGIEEYLENKAEE